MSIEIRSDIGHEILVKGVTEVKFGRETTVSELVRALGTLDAAEPIIDFYIDEASDHLFLLVGGERT